MQLWESMEDSKKIKDSWSQLLRFMGVKDETEVKAPIFITKTSVTPIYLLFIIQLWPDEDPKLLWAPNNFICHTK